MNQDRYREYEEVQKGANDYPAELDHINSRLNQKIRRKAAKHFLTGMSTFMGVLVLCTAIINTSSVAAQAVSRIPVLGSLAEYLKFDQGLQNAIKNEYVQEVNLKQESNGYTLKLPYVIADSKQLVLFFELPESLDQTETYEVGLDDSFLNQLDIVKVNVRNFQNETGADGSGLFMVSMRSFDSEIPQDITIPVSLVKSYSETRIYDGLDNYFPQQVADEPTVLATYEFKFHLNDFSEPKIRALNQEVQVNGQPVTIQSVTEYPTGVEVKVIAPNEGTSIVRDLTIEGVDRNGNLWEKPSGVRASYYYDYDATEMIYYLENDYFSNVSLAGLEITGAGMFLKEERMVTVDLLNKTMTPAISDLTIKSVVRQGENANITFESDIVDADTGLIFYDRYEDLQGNAYSWDIQRASQRDGKTQYYITVVWPEDNRVIFERYRSPITRLDDPIRVSLPLS